MNKLIQKYIPNTMTFVSLACGLISIVISGQEMLLTAGLLIIASVILDSLDGFTARQLKVTSGFGKQLDSLVDVVSFGVAPIVLGLDYLQLRGDYYFWILPVVTFYIWAGAFRLARFNLDQNPKENGESTGLTITQSGLMVALTVLSDLTRPDHVLPLGGYVMIFLVLGYMMASRIKFPNYTWFVPKKWTIPLYLVIATVLFFITSIFQTLLIISFVSLAASIFRYILQKSRLSSEVMLNE